MDAHAGTAVPDHHSSGGRRVPLDPFDERYRAFDDPWEFGSSPYEQRRYDLTMAALTKPRYRRAFEPACSIGELTSRLAERCDEVVALDPSATAVRRARTRAGEAGRVEFRVGAVPEAWPEGRFDLIVLSEIGYYFEADGVRRLLELASNSWTVGGGELAAVHWRGVSDDHLLSGDAVHRVFREELGAPLAHYEQAEFLLDVWSTP